MRILCIEDDRVVADEIVLELRRGGFEVEHEEDGLSGLARARTGHFDAITLDRMLPSMDGIAIVSALRAEGNMTPVLMISALTDVDERIRGLRAGGDDYLAKPFASEEMVVRVDVLIRRRAAMADTATMLSAGGLKLDLIAHQARRGDDIIRLQPTEYKLLEFFMRHPGRTLTRAILFEEVFGYRFDPGTNLIDVHIGRLRRKIDLQDRPSIIRTVRGSGWVAFNQPAWSVEGPDAAGRPADRRVQAAVAVGAGHALHCAALGLPDRRQSAHQARIVEPPVRQWL